MTIADLIRSESREDRRNILLAASAAGIANTLVLITVTARAQAGGDVGPRFFAIFVLSIVLYVVGARFTFHRIATVVEAALHRIKVRIVDKVERAQLRGLERLGAAEIYDRVTQNTSVISLTAGVVANLLQSLCVFVFAAIYILWLSRPAFVFIAFILGLGTTLYLSKAKELGMYLRQHGQTRLTFFDLLTDLLRGIKELKFSARRSRELRQDIVRTSASLRDVTDKANHLFDDNYILANSNLFIVLGAMVFIVPQHADMGAETLTKLVAGVVFIWGPISAIVSSYPSYIKSTQALDAIAELEKKLDDIAGDSVPLALHDPWNGQLSTLELRGVEYGYERQDGGTPFHVGPVSLSVSAGEVLFIVGGNGSGKSTLFKVLSGLYSPSGGGLYVNGIAVGADNVPYYREMISAIYSDFHLFSKVYGLLDVEEAAVRRLLVQMQLEGETGFHAQRFTKRELSTGQRKRLAMILALLEDRPLYLFDEWAADQDPEFRRYFYEELLPALKQRGKTVLAVTHDDRYFHHADRVVRMDYGKLRVLDG